MDISSGGILFETHGKLDVGMQVKLLVALEHYDRRSELTGRIVRREDEQAMGRNRFGIEFIACSDDYEAWENLFHSNPYPSFIENTNEGTTP